MTPELRKRIEEMAEEFDLIVPDTRPLHTDSFIAGAEAMYGLMSDEIAELKKKLQDAWEEIDEHDLRSDDP